MFNFVLITGLLEKLFNNRFTVTLGRLSYSVFLVNLVVMMMSQSAQRLPSYPSAKSLVSNVFGSKSHTNFKITVVLFPLFEYYCTIWKRKIIWILCLFSVGCLGVRHVQMLSDGLIFIFDRRSTDGRFDPKNVWKRVNYHVFLHIRFRKIWISIRKVKLF